MKKEKYVEIKGVKFERVKSLYLKNDYELKAIYDCYDRPSTYKVNAYNYWVDYARGLDLLKVAYYGVASYNSNIFTFDFCFKYESKKYYAHITPSHNYICEVIA